MRSRLGGQRVRMALFRIWYALTSFEENYMFNFDAWMRAYVKLPFGPDAELRSLDEQLWSATWPVVREGVMLRRGAVLLQLEDVLLASLHRSSEQRRADVGQKTSGLLFHRLNGYRRSSDHAVPLTDRYRRERSQVGVTDVHLLINFFVCQLAGPA